MIYFGCHAKRRALTRAHPTLNGIDYLEVVDDGVPGNPERQRTLRVFLLKPPVDDPPRHELRARLTGQQLQTDHVRLSGGEKVRAVQADQVRWVTGAPDRADHLAIHLERRGDFSRYTLALVEKDTGRPLAGLDPQLAAVEFSFKVRCDNPFDCHPAGVCAVETPPGPAIDYLAKDYGSFRQLLLDRMALTLPEWRRRNPADLGVMLVELLAYVGDQLSYRQDAVATEAYLGTARQRVSVRRHVRLLDYPMHDGCNARVWVQICLQDSAPAAGVTIVPPDRAEIPRPGDPSDLRLTRFVTNTSASGAAPQPVLTERQFQERLRAQPDLDVFEPLAGATLYPGHNEFQFYTWGGAQCCLPQGATCATLRGHWPKLQRGAFLALLERQGPATGRDADADPRRRHVVRLRRVEAFAPDDLPLTDPVTGVEITEIEWPAGDALPFALTLSSVRQTDGQPVEDVSVALGNLVLADHGRTVREAGTMHAGAFGPVALSNPALAPVTPGADCGCADSARREVPARFRPHLAQSPVTQAPPLRMDEDTSASALLQSREEEILPAIRLGDSQGQAWRPRRDLIDSGAFARDFVAEVENDGRVALRFGDDENGQRPAPGLAFAALYRVGNGVRGNIGIEAVAQVVCADLTPDIVKSVANPVPGRGASEPESLEQVRQYAPAAFRVNQRCVTPDDYARRAGEHPEVQRAAATLRWTGSWHTVFLTVDRKEGRPVDAAFEQELRDFLEPWRLAGHDLEIDMPRFVSLEMKLTVCVAAEYFQTDVEAALRAVLGSGELPDGTRGFFHPDNFTFGQPVVASRIYAAAQRVPGVRYLSIDVLKRQGRPDQPPPDSGVFELDRLEIARLENDRNFPDHGLLRFEMRGGR
jgi:hypothetical protein